MTWFGNLLASFIFAAVGMAIWQTFRDTLKKHLKPCEHRYVPVHFVMKKNKDLLVAMPVPPGTHMCTRCHDLVTLAPPS